MHSPPPRIHNRMLLTLPASIQANILAHCDIQTINFGDILCQPNQPIEFVYFPTSGFVSLLTTLDGREPLEMGLIGNEGVLGATLVFGANTSSLQMLVQGSGSLMRLPAANLHQLIEQHPPLHSLLTRYLYVLMEQLIQSAACTHFHEIEPRLARWLLMSFDRALDAPLHFTHQFLAGMLGVRRSGITIAAGKLQNRGFIDYNRGSISLVDRAGLESASCACYRKIQSIYDRQFEESPSA